MNNKTTNRYVTVTADLYCAPEQQFIFRPPEEKKLKLSDQELKRELELTNLKKHLGSNE